MEKSDNLTKHSFLSAEDHKNIKLISSLASKNENLKGKCLESIYLICTLP